MIKVISLTLITAISFSSWIVADASQVPERDEFDASARRIIVSAYFEKYIEARVELNKWRRSQGNHYQYDSTLLDVSMYDSTKHGNRSEFAAMNIRELGKLKSPFSALQIRAYAVKSGGYKESVCILAKRVDSVWMIEPSQEHALLTLAPDSVLTHYAKVVSGLMDSDEVGDLDVESATELTMFTFKLSETVLQTEPKILYKWEDIFDGNLTDKTGVSHPEKDSVFVRIAAPAAQRTERGYVVTVYSRWDDTSIHMSAFTVTDKELKLRKDTVLGKRGVSLLKM